MNVERHFVFSVVFSSAGMMTIFCPFESVVTWLDFFSVFCARRSHVQVDLGHTSP